jgi:polyisoprenoid-binding protein YceI
VVVPLQPASYRFGPDTATLAVRTGRVGAVAKAGHNLLLHVTSWEASMQVAEQIADSTVELTADGSSLRVREGTGGMKALDDDDMANIEQTIDEDVLKRTAVSFRSTQVEGTQTGMRVQGELTMLGATRPITLDVDAGDGSLRATAVVKQTDFGMKPYSALFGALKVADDVQVTLVADLPA